MTEDEKRIEEKLDQVIAALPTIYALGEILVPRTTVNERARLNKNTLAQNKNVKKYEPAGVRKTLVEIKDLVPILNRKRRKSPAK